MPDPRTPPRKGFFQRLLSPFKWLLGTAVLMPLRPLFFLFGNKGNNLRGLRGMLMTIGTMGILPTLLFVGLYLLVVRAPGSDWAPREIDRMTPFIIQLALTMGLPGLICVVAAIRLSGVTPVPLHQVPELAPLMPLHQLTMVVLKVIGILLSVNMIALTLLALGAAFAMIAIFIIFVLIVGSFGLILLSGNLKNVLKKSWLKDIFDFALSPVRFFKWEGEVLAGLGLHPFHTFFAIYLAVAVLPVVLSIRILLLPKGWTAPYLAIFGSHPAGGSAGQQPQ